ncbi:Hypothetical protein CINCED_3A000415 [Cinara cedri]|uniref:Uncharacterized protein n=1 Tax=Cinara cedri TaxID=506608 RepID=A0A5E4NBY9_9HEMI|nr:Hypothetical protein CINCED_3A000415 [Cinara cedri]
MADENIILFLGYQLFIKDKKKIIRQMGRLLNSARPSEGAFNIIFENIRRDPVKFFNYFRMNVSEFDKLLTVYLGTRLLGIDTYMRKSITPAEVLTVDTSIDNDELMNTENKTTIGRVFYYCVCVLHLSL